MIKLILFLAWAHIKKSIFIMCVFLSIFNLFLRLTSIVDLLI